MRSQRLRLAEEGVVWQAAEGGGGQLVRFSVVSFTWGAESRYALTALRVREGRPGLDAFALSPAVPHADLAGEILRRVALRPDPVSPVHLSDVVHDLLAGHDGRRSAARPRAAV